MEAFALYLFKSVIWISGFTLIYYLFLRNERYFLLNRIYLVSGILVSIFFPLISVHYQVLLPAQVISTFNSSPFAVQSDGDSYLFDFRHLLLWSYVAGIVFFAFRLIWHLRSLRKTINKANINTQGKAKLIRSSEFSASFSFFNYIFVNPSITDLETEEIMNHELVHIQQKHWFDLVLVELLRIFQWFNPLVWIYVRFMRQNHEYLADEIALQRTSNPANYKAALLNQIVGSNVVSLTNSFNYSLNKKRFNMMKNIMSSPYRKLKLLVILPVFAIILYAFAEPDYSYTPITQSSVRPLNPVEPTTPLLIIQQQPTSPKTLTPPPPPTLPTPPPPPPPPPPVPQESPSSVLNIRTVDGKSPLIIVDGIVTDIKVDKIDPNTIKSVNVLKGSSAIEKYGEIARDGVIEITLKRASDSPSGSNSEVKFIGYGAQNNGNSLQGVKVIGYGVQKNGDSLQKGMIRSTGVNNSGPSPLIIIDGVESGTDIKGINISPNDIETMSIFKSESSTRLYGDKAKGGVIIITTKKKLNRSYFPD